MIASAASSRDWIVFNQVLWIQQQRGDPLWINALGHGVIALENHLKAVSNELIVWLVLILQAH
jgi:hypothetical protein